MNQRIEEMLRVDHAGEHGAVAIYRGQLAVFGQVKNKARTTALIQHMAEQEREHLEMFDALLLERQIRPTALSPLWHATGFMLGAMTALIGEKTAMMCTAAVEEVIEDHYTEQIEELAEYDTESALKRTLEKCRDDETEHRHRALSEGAEEAPFHGLLSGMIKTACHVAIKLSSKI